MTSPPSRNAASFGSHPGLEPDKQSQLEPLPVAVDVGEADLPEPTQLALDISQAIRGSSHSIGSPIASKKRS